MLSAKPVPLNLPSKQRFVFIMLGLPGSGKSYVSEWLGPAFGAVHIRTDDLRNAMFGEEKLEFHKNHTYQNQVHGAAFYIVEQIVQSGHSAIYDANHNSRQSREPLQRLALKAHALPVLVWTKVPLSVAEQRVLEREAAGGMKVFEPEFVKRMARNLQPPSDDELYIELDGQASQQSQQQHFREQLTKILEKQVQ